jgi:hypothetical protein
MAANGMIVSSGGLGRGGEFEEESDLSEQESVLSSMEVFTSHVTTMHRLAPRGFPIEVP